MTTGTLKPRHLRRIAKAFRLEVERSPRAGQPIAVLSLVAPELGTGLPRYRWEARARIGPRLDPGRFEGPRPWHPAPLTYAGVATTRLDAERNVRAVADVLFHVYATLVGPLHDLETITTTIKP